MKASRRAVMAAMIIAVAIAPHNAGASPGNLVLPSTVPWEIGSHKQACHLIGGFGQGDEQVIMRLSQRNLADAFSLSLFGKPFASEAANLPISLDFGQENGPARLNAVTDMSGERPAMFAGPVTFTSSADSEPDRMMSIEEMRELASKPRGPQVTFAQETAVTHLVVGLPGNRTVTLQLGSMGGPMIAMRGCIRQMIKSWGFDPNVIAGLTKLPEPLMSQGLWVSAWDYPADSLRNRKEGVVYFRLDVAADGKVSRCTNLESTANKDLIVTTCQLMMRRARFKPALDANGQPVAAFFTSSVRWQLPR